jgi:hypothetical protein
MVRAEARPSAERLEMLRWIARLGAVTAEALAARERRSIASARGRLGAAVGSGLLRRHALLRGRPALFTVTRGGLRACGLRGAQPTRVSAASADHAIVCASVAVALGARYPDHAVIGVPELRRLERGLRRPLARAEVRGRGGAPAMHRPDLVLLPHERPPSEAIAVEVELTVKAPARLEEICRAWVRSRSLAGVLYVAAPRVEAPLRRALDGARACDRVAIVALSTLLE